MLEDEKQSFLMYWYKVKNNDILEIDIGELNYFKIINPNIFELLMQREIIIPKIIKKAIENGEIILT